MFTGIIEEIGQIIKSYSDTIEIKCSKVLEGTKIGDSICVNGVCQTVDKLSKTSFTTRLSKTTREITTFSQLKTGDEVNLERALTLDTRLGGHLVSGHVEGIGKIIKTEKLSDFYNVYIKIPENIEKYVVNKGSITIDGISLTVANIENCVIMIAVIPHTYCNTTLKNSNQHVNIETDILSKYVEKFLSTNNNIKKGIDIDFLTENGF